MHPPKCAYMLPKGGGGGRGNIAQYKLITSKGKTLGDYLCVQLSAGEHAGIRNLICLRVFGHECSLSYVCFRADTIFALAGERICNSEIVGTPPIGAHEGRTDGRKRRGESGHSFFCSERKNNLPYVLYMLALNSFHKGLMS